jgi:hypothetical protein
MARLAEQFDPKQSKTTQILHPYDTFGTRSMEFSRLPQEKQARKYSIKKSL